MPRVHVHGFELQDAPALDALHARLAAAGLVSQDRDASVCCYAAQDKFWVTDPDGYRWELYRLLEDTETRDGPRPTACCS